MRLTLIGLLRGRGGVTLFSGLDVGYTALAIDYALPVTDQLMSTYGQFECDIPIERINLPILSPRMSPPSTPSTDSSHWLG